MSFLKELAAQRAKLLDGLEANKNEINLDIFEDFYPDQAHFVFELLQNAEDAGATEVSFDLVSDSCTFEHNGTRAFTESDVRGITGLNNSTKGNSSDQIGKFGVGFKSVFVYTKIPVVYSSRFSFRILDYVMPDEIARDQTIGTQTRFYLPFNNPRKTPDLAYSEISACLKNMSETTLLFLSNIESIRWKIHPGDTGEILRFQHTDHHFEVLKQTDSKTTKSFHFLRFSQTIEGLGKQSVAVAFVLELLPKVQHFDPQKPLSKQLKIVPAMPGRVAVFFPAEKEVSGLRFHLHAPFVPELSRASIKETPINLPLFQQLAVLTATALYQIRDMDLLTPEFLGILPNPKDSIPNRYRIIRSTVIEEMNNHPLTPSSIRSYAPAKSLLQGRPSLKALLAEGDLEFLVKYNGTPPLWACARAPAGTDTERFMAGLAIKEWDIKEFVGIISEKLQEGPHYISSPPYHVVGPDQKYINWLSAQSVDWHQRLYSLLHTELPGLERKQLHNLKFVRLADGSYSIGSKCFIPCDDMGHDEALPHVDIGIYTSGTNSTQQQNAKNFLREIGVRDIGEAEEIEAILEKRYTKDRLSPKKEDMKRFVAFIESNPSKSDIFLNYFIFERKDGRWGKPGSVFLDKPFMDTGLCTYYESISENYGPLELAEGYSKIFASSAENESFVRFSEAVGVIVALNIKRKPVVSHNDQQYLMSDCHQKHVRRTDSQIDEDWDIDNLAQSLENPSTALAKLIWKTLQKADTCVLLARYRPNQTYDIRTAPSSLILTLRNCAWIPQHNETFVRPAEAIRDLLPDDFAVDLGWQWLKSINFGKKEEEKSEQKKLEKKIAQYLGFNDVDTLDHAKRFAALPIAEREAFLSDREGRRTTNLPNHEPRNPDHRAERISAQAASAPERRTEMRTRSVSINRDPTKEEAKQYLQQQYTDRDGNLVCQLCQAPMPFKRLDGTDYFEAVEFLTSLKRHHDQNYLALCAHHSAMFKYANDPANRILERFIELTGNELEVVLGQKQIRIYFTKTHIADLKTVIKSD